MPESARILMVAPQPFFRSRGTPFSVLHRIRALLLLGHRVELLTYPLGDHPSTIAPLNSEHLVIHRSRRPPLVRDVKIGPSLAKVALDGPLFMEARRLVRSGRFDVLHTHEEAGIAGAWLSRSYGIPHIYDMHSSLPQQFENFDRFNWRPVISAFRRLERYAVIHADGIIAVYHELRDHVRSLGYSGPVAVIENTLDFPRKPIDPERVQATRTRLGLADHPTVAYTGTLERYQGMELLLRAAEHVRRRLPEARILSVGGTPDQIEKLRNLAHHLGVADSVVFVPMVPPREVFVFHELADALITTRTHGTNTPLKIYQYLRSGKPIIATAIPSHEQVLDETVAELVPPHPTGVADGIIRVLSNPERATSLARAAAQLAEERFTEKAYVDELDSFIGNVLMARPLRGAGANSDGA